MALGSSNTQGAAQAGGKFGDLRRRLVFLLLALVVFRIGAHIQSLASTQISCLNYFQVKKTVFWVCLTCSQVAPYHALPSLRWASCLTFLHRSSCS